LQKSRDFFGVFDFDDCLVCSRIGQKPVAIVTVFEGRERLMRREVNEERVIDTYRDESPFIDK
jgi:hypothetical protein